jgi:hypothetical protein
VVVSRLPEAGHAFTWRLGTVAFPFSGLRVIETLAQWGANANSGTGSREQVSLCLVHHQVGRLHSPAMFSVD